MRLLPALLFVAAMGVADVRNCVCDLASTQSMDQFQCALCREAEKQPAEPAVFFLKDNNPRKPDRWLALPRAHTHPIADLTPAERLALWTGAIKKGQELWGSQWGLAVNSDARRTQCHAHVHIGKLLDSVETSEFVVVDGPAAIPIAAGGAGFWIHAVDGKFHVHQGVDAPELLLMR